VGERFLIAPSWSVPDDVGERLLIVIDPGMAFGTGTHETTQECLAAIEQYWTGRSLLDVGTGTGLLAIAAAKLSPAARIVALDIDPDAVQVAGENTLLNGVGERVTLVEGSVDQVSSKFEMIVANLTTDVHLKLIDRFARLIEDRGVVVLSGILLEDETIIAEALADSGLRPIEIKRNGEWLAFVAERTK
jgi:ribosomal protein L11 methyltransferase